MVKVSFALFQRFTLFLIIVFSFFSFSPAQADEIAKQAFGKVKTPSSSKAQSIGFYSKGCLAGGEALALNGENWQVMRPSRNRYYGHPALIAFLQNLSKNAKNDGWNGLLIGDLSQARGGPMLTGHVSHQVGLDADIWFTPMPNYRLSAKERENISAISMLKKDTLLVDPKKWSPSRTNLLRHAAEDEQVERIFVHPGIKKQLCETVKGDRSWLAKIRPYFGHYYHFHVRLKCQGDSKQCKPQAKISKSDGCDKSLAWWFTDEPWVPKKPKDDKPKTKPQTIPKPLMMSNLPKACQIVLNAK